MLLSEDVIGFIPCVCQSAVVLHQYNKVPDFGCCLRKYKEVPEKIPSTEGAHSSFFLLYPTPRPRIKTSLNGRKKVCC